MSAVIDNIKAMLEAVKAERRTLEQRLEILGDREDTLEAWLAEEAPRQGELPVNGFEGTPLAAFLRSTLEDRQPHSVQELGALAATREGLIGPDKSPGRVVHFALLGLQQHGLVRRTEDGKKWVRA